ncbi:MAG TPA: SRPBCC family protein [Streptosporangiaceae bacterium]|nr:SRPBCC family protein [Streptosporangiaceae bacterium]
MAELLEITSRVLVRASQERVWRAAIDWRRQGEWMWGTQVSGGHGAGARVSARTGIGPVGFTDTMVITEWDPPRRCVVQHTGRVVRGDGVFEAVPRGPHCEFVWIERLELPKVLVGAVGRALVRPVAQAGLDSSLRRFARLVERS